MADPYLQDLDERALALLQSTGNTPEDYAKDPSLAGGMDVSGAPPEAVDSLEGDQETAQETAPAEDPYASLRDQALRSLIDTKYPTKKDESGKLFTAEGAGKASLAFHRAGGGKLKDDFFKPADTSTEDAKRAQYELSKAGLMAKLLGKGGAGGGNEKTSAFAKAVYKKLYPNMVAENPEAFQVADLDEVTKAGTLSNSGENRRTRLTQQEIANEFRDRGMDEAEIQHLINNNFRERAQAVKISNHEKKAVTDYATKIAPDAPIFHALASIDSVAPGLVEGKITPETAELLSLANKLKANPAFRGFGSQLMKDKAIRLNAEMANFAQTVARPQVGSNFTEPEMRNFARILNSQIGSTPEAQAQSVNMVREQLGRKLRSIHAAYAQEASPEVWQQYGSSYGVVPGYGVLSNIPEGPLASRPLPLASPPSRSDEQAIRTELENTRWSTPGSGQPSQPAPAAPQPAAQPDPQRSAAEEWLHANPNHPKAAAVRAKLGTP